MLHTKFQTTGPSGSEEDDFLIYFYAFLLFELRTPWRGTILVHGTLLNKIGKGPLDNATY